MIPRVFHSIWVGPPIPDHLQQYLATWTAVHPSWVHRHWEAKDLRWLDNQALFDDAEAHTSSVGQFRSDVARYEILHRHGGIYVDCDFESLGSLDDLLAGVECFAAWETDNVWVGNAILGSVPGHPFLKELIDGLPANVKAKQGKRPNYLSGPRYVTPIAKGRDDVTIFPSAAFYPYNFSELERGGESFPDAYAVHHWQNQRNRRARA